MNNCLEIVKGEMIIMDERFKVILNENLKIKKLFDDVKRKIEVQGKKLFIVPNVSSSKKEFLGQIEEKGEQIVISIDTSLINNKEKLIAVLIHELGEADYIACGLPMLTSEEEGYEEESVKKIREILTHNHIRRIINKYELNEEIKNLEEESNKPSSSQDKCIRVINTLHNIMTYYWNVNLECDRDIETYAQRKKY